MPVNQSKSNCCAVLKLFQLVLCLAGWMIFQSYPAMAADEKVAGKYAMHNYTAKLRGSAWFTFVDGEVQGERPVSGGNVAVQFDSDLGYDDPYPTAIIEGAYRQKRHDFWIVGSRFDESETAPIDFTFEIDDKIFDFGGDVTSKAELTDINFRYGYSFYTFENDGFRFGPTVAVSYTEFDIELREIAVAGISIPAIWQYDDQVPIPTIGMHLEIPYGEFVFVGQLGGFYFEADNFEGTGIRAELSATWRPYEHVGFYAGFYSMYADLKLKNEEIDDLLLFGPSIGIELRF